MTPQEAKELGFSTVMIRDTFWEKNSDKLREFKELGFEDSDIFSAVTEKFGADDILLSTKGTRDEFSHSVSKEQMQEVFSMNKYLTEDVMKVDTHEGFTQPEDVKSTIDSVEYIQYNIEESKKQNAMIGSFMSGAKTLPIGVSVMAQDFANFIMSYDDDFTKEDYYNSAKEWATDNQEKIKKYNEIAGFEKDAWLTPDTFGQLTAELMTLSAVGLKAVKGIKWLKDMKTTSQAALAEGALAGVSAKGEGKTYQEAGASSLMTMVGTKVGGEILDGVFKLIDDPAMIKNIVSGKASDKQTLDYLIKASGETEDSLTGFYQKYAEATKKNFNDLTEVDKIQAIVKNSGAGSKFKTEAEYFGEDVLSKTNYFEHQVKNLFEKNLKGANIPSEKLQEFLDGASSNYTEIKSILDTNFDSMVKIPSDNLSELIAGVRRASNNQNSVIVGRVMEDLERGAKEKLDLETMFSLKRDLNSLNLSGMKGFKAGKVGDFIDDTLNSHFISVAGKEEGELANKLWKQANARYAQKKAIEDGDNWITGLIQKKGSEDISADDFANAVISQTERGAAKFNQLKDFIGEEGTAEVEKQIIKNIFEKKKGLNASLEYIRGFDFVTVEGKSLRDELVRLEGVIPKESSIKLLQKYIGSKDIGTVGFSDNLVSKFKYSIIGKTYNAILTRMPSAAPERAFRNLGDILKKGIDNIDIDIKKDPSLQKAFEEELQMVRNDVQKLKDMGNSRTRAENMRLAELKKMEASIAKQIPMAKDLKSDIPMGYRKNEVVPDEIIDAEPISQNIYDAEIIPNKQLEYKDIQTSAKNVDVNIEDFRKKKLNALENIKETKSSKIKHILFRNLSDDFKDSEETKGFVMMALENGNQLAKDKVGKATVTSKAGMTKEGNFLRQQTIDTGAIQTNLSKASVNRIRLGKGTKEDLEKLKLDVDELRRLDDYYNQYEAGDVF